MQLIALALTALLFLAGDGDTEMGVRKKAIREVNQLRIDRGLDRLRWDRSLSPGTRAHSRTMAGEGTIFHSDDLVDQLDNAVGQDRWSLGGENVGMVPVGDFDGLFKAFRQSKEHRRNMLRPRYDNIGVGVARDGNGHLYLTYWFYDRD